MHGRYSILELFSLGSYVYEYWVDIIPFTCQENEPWHCYWVAVKEANWGENVVQFRIISTTGMVCAVQAHSVDLLHYSLILNL